MSKLLASKLRHRITLQSIDIAVDPADGSITESWVEVASLVPAEIVPLSGREFLASQSTQAGVSARITIRHTDDIDPSMRILTLDGDIYNIKAILPDPTGQRHLTIMAEQGVNLG